MNSTATNGKVRCSACVRVNKDFLQLCEECKRSDPTSCEDELDGAPDEKHFVPWPCASCSFINLNNRHRCEMCDNSRGCEDSDYTAKVNKPGHFQFTHTEEGEDKAAPAAGNKSDKWKCPGCTYENTAGRPGCEMCNGEPPEGYRVTTDNQTRYWEDLQKDRERQFLQKQEELNRKRGDELLSELKEFDDKAIVAPKEEFECPICFQDIHPGAGIRLRGCLHDLCRECLTGAVKSEESGDVKCCICHAEIEDRDIMNVVGPVLWEKHLQRTLRRGEANIKNTFHCLTPDCLGFAEIVDEVNDFECPVCKRMNCIPCKAIHVGQTCQQYHDSIKVKANDDDYEAKLTLQMFKDMIDNGEAMECPSCKIFLQKRVGCDWMMCTMCKTEICWATKGRRWGPKGEGDTSGGCRCGVGGRRCHPNCRYCH